MRNMENLVGEVICFKNDVWEDDKLIFSAGCKTVIYHANDQMEIFSFVDPVTLDDVTMAYEEFEKYLHFENSQIDAWQQDWVEKERQTKGGNMMNFENLFGETVTFVEDYVVGGEVVFTKGDKIIIADVNEEEQNICIFYDQETEEEHWVSFQEFRVLFQPLKDEEECQPCQSNTLDVK